MAKYLHEIRDPVHGFIRLDSHERELLDSRPLQRLRHIHQLGVTYFLYPGATHRRFEHSLGVMELAGRIFDVVTAPQHLSDDLRDSLEPLNQPDGLRYWRRVLRAAALCHDVGHPPFSHVAEELLPQGKDHEQLSRDVLLSDEMREFFADRSLPLKPEHVVKLALGPEKAAKLGLELDRWETILSEMIVGDAFGADRMDYLLRDSLHTGVAYGHFDHLRLVDTMRILFGPPIRTGSPPWGWRKGGCRRPRGW